jgi:hypothetical protein
MQKQKYTAGDWVKDRRYPNHDWIQLGEAVETTMGAIVYDIGGDRCFWQSDIGEKWEPKVNEWCWMFFVGFVKIIELSKENDEFSYVTVNSNEVKTSVLSFKTLQPFIGKLPTFIGE